MARSALIYSLLLLLAWSTAMAAPPTSQPAIDVAIAPFSAIGDSAAPTWIGMAVQQNLITDLARRHFRPSDSAGTDGYIIRGSYQYSDQQIRFSGQLSEARTGRVVGGLSATGALRDLFALEDNLSDQAIQQLRQLTAPPVPVSPQAAPAVARPPAIVPPPAETYDGSALQYYVDTNQAPSNDYTDQYNASSYRQMYQYNNYFGCYYGYGPYWGWYSPFYPRFGFGFNGFYSGGTYGTTTR